MLSKCQQISETSTISCQVLFIILRIKMHLVIYDLSDQVFAFSSKIYQLSDISIESLKKLTWNSSKSKLSNSGCILSWLLNLVQTFRHARPCLQDLNESQGIPNCWEVWFWRSQLSLRLNAKIIGLLSYFISPMAGGITDIRQGPGPRSPRWGVTWPVMKCWPMADVPHDMLCFTLSGWWILYSMTAACLLFPYEVFMFLLIAASISSTVTSLAWSWPGHPNPPLCQSWPQIAGATKHSTRLHL